jgi:hypothetical protein
VTKPPEEIDMGTITYDRATGGWERLLAAVRANERIFATGEPQFAALQFHLEEVRDAKMRQQFHSAGRKRATRDLKQGLAAGHDAAVRLQSLVKGQLGPRDEGLVQFDIAPRRKRVRKATGSRPAPAAADSKGQEPAK